MKNTRWLSTTIFKAKVVIEAMLGTPEISISDQGSQFTSLKFTGALKSWNIRISIEDKGCPIDNLNINRLWRGVKYDDVYLNPANGGVELYR